MGPYTVVIGTHVLYSAFNSKSGAAFKLISLIDTNLYKIQLSVPLVLEYEDVLNRQENKLIFTKVEISQLVDYIIYKADWHEIYFLWRPYLLDPKDDMILELALKSQADFIITFNVSDFKGVDALGVKVCTPAEFLTFSGH
jgi:putative PIN family toxin of toxin-antitoxin system